jgi:hypothetical protein
LEKKKDEDVDKVGAKIRKHKAGPGSGRGPWRHSTKTKRNEDFDIEMARVLINGGSVNKEEVRHTDGEAPWKTAIGEQERAEVLEDRGAVVVEEEVGEEEKASTDDPLSPKKRPFVTSNAASMLQGPEIEDYFKEADDEHDIAGYQVPAAKEASGRNR